MKQELQIGVVRGDAILRGKETTPVIWNLLVRHRLTSGEHEVKDRVWRRLSFFDVIKGELVLRVKCVYYYYVKNDCLKQVPAPSHAGEPLRKKLIKCSL